MKKFTLFLASICLNILIFGQTPGPYDPPVGQPGSQAISKDSSIIQSWATGAEIQRGYIQITDTSVSDQGSNRASFGYPAKALFQAEGTSYGVISLGDSGVITLTFEYPIINGQGKDFVVFENSFNHTFLELGFVEVSSDGENFYRFPTHSLTQTNSQVGGFGSLDATQLDGFAGKYKQGYGVGFDLDDLPSYTNLDLNNIRFVRVIDCIGNIDGTHTTYDSQGNAVNDPFPTPFLSSGFDLDAIGVINQATKPFEISEIDDLSLAQDSYWDGSDLSGGFTSGIAYFPNLYDSTYGSWSGFGYSNMRDDSTAGFTNQFSSISAGGLYADDNGGTNYIVAFVPLDYQTATYEPIPLEVEWTDTNTHIPSGFYACNSTYATLSMLNGDGFAKKFGGATGNDPDYFKLLVYGEKADGSITDTVEFYLADYRFADNSKDYIVQDWTWVDLYKLGEVKKLYYSLASSDVGTNGMNTPAYFCMDNFMVYPAMLNAAIAEETNNIDFTVYPNPSDGQFKINTGKDMPYNVYVYDVSGRLATQINQISDQETINLNGLESGLYILQIVSNEFTGTTQIMIK